MIYLYSGTPGSGKSLHVARVIVEHLRMGRPVIGNFGLALEKLRSRRLGEYLEVDNMELTVDLLLRCSMGLRALKGGRLREGYILLVIDESQILFNSRDYGRSDRRDWLSFFSQHRKLGYNVVLVAQYDRMLDRQIRALVEYEYIHRKVSNFGTVGFLLGAFFGGNLFVCVKKWYPMKEKIGSEFFIARKKYYGLYDTFTLFSAPDRDGESKGPRRERGQETEWRSI